jgi:hypothetical protein
MTPPAESAPAALQDQSKQAGKPGVSGTSQSGGIAGSAFFGLVAINESKGCNSFDAGMTFYANGTAAFSFNGGEWEEDLYSWTQQGDTVTLTISRGETWRLTANGATLSGTYDDGSCTGAMTLTRR